MAKKIRPLGDIMLDMEPLLMEMTHKHDLQWHEVLNLVRGYLEVHFYRNFIEFGLSFTFLKGHISEHIAKEFKEHKIYPNELSRVIGAKYFFFDLAEYTKWLMANKATVDIVETHEGIQP